MHRKDYIQLAAALASCRPRISARSTKEQHAYYEIWHRCRAAIISTLAADNSRFDRQRFIAATEED